MPKPRFVDYSGAAPILLPVSLLSHWHGFYLPAKECDAADLDVPAGRFKICEEFDFKNPKTDYDRACALGGVPPVQQLQVGPGFGLYFATELDNLTWWQEHLMLVNGYSLPDTALLKRVEWSDECKWRAIESNLVLMSACQHGASPDLGPHFEVQLEPGLYVIQWGAYGWADEDPTMILFQFIKQSSG